MVNHNSCMTRMRQNHRVRNIGSTILIRTGTALLGHLGISKSSCTTRSWHSFSDNSIVITSVRRFAARRQQRLLRVLTDTLTGAPFRRFTISTDGLSESLPDRTGMAFSTTRLRLVGLALVFIYLSLSVEAGFFIFRVGSS
jgi:hypothetical protein